MNAVDGLMQAGFARVIVLDGAQCGHADVGSILLALWPYAAEAEPAAADAWIHPYYFASQQAYNAAAAFARAHERDGIALRDDIRVKPIFAGLPGFSQGRNTLSYTEEFGSRFHVQILTCSQPLEPTHHLEEADHAPHCGSCNACVRACPVNALEGGVFHRERCLRNWQMSGQPVPEALRAHMGNRLIGCDVCQRVCPRNAPAAGESHPPVSLQDLLETPRQTALSLRPVIGVNLTIPNRVLSQSCLIAGCSGRADLLPLLERLHDHPSAAVAEHARWATEQIRLKHL